MYTENNFSDSSEDLNVKKTKERLPNINYYNTYYSSNVIDSFLNLLTQTGRFWLGIAGASIEAMRTFNTEFFYRSLRQEGYSNDYIKSFFETNADYHERMARNAEMHKIATFEKNADFHQYMSEKYRHAAENINQRNEEPVIATAAPIDYELLAKKVAEELKKTAL